MIRDSRVLSTLVLVSLAGCSSTAPASNEIARESAETNAVIEAAKNHPALTGKSAEAAGKPLPPLAGVNVAAPVSNQTDDKADHDGEHPH
jgi:outer membrane murein-binding lipoprotein Lpp